MIIFAPKARLFFQVPNYVTQKIFKISRKNAILHCVTEKIFNYVTEKMRFWILEKSRNHHHYQRSQKNHHQKITTTLGADFTLRFRH